MYSETVATNKRIFVELMNVFIDFGMCTLCCENSVSSIILLLIVLDFEVY